MRFERLTPGEVLAAVAALTMFGLMYGVWFEHPTAADIPPSAIGFQTRPDAWHAFAVIDWVLVAAAACTISAALLTAADSRIGLPLSGSAVIAVMGGVSALLIAYRIIDPINVNGVDYRRDLPLFLAGGSAGLIALGGIWALRSEGSSLSAELGRAARREPMPERGRPAAPAPAGSERRSRRSSTRTRES